MHPQRPLSGRIRERSAAAREASALHTGDPAHLEFRLWLMTLQIKPVIFRHEVSCRFSSRRQPPPSKTAVSQRHPLFSPHPVPRKGGCSNSWGGEDACSPPPSCRDPPPRDFGINTERMRLRQLPPGAPAQKDPSSPYKLAGLRKSMSNNFCLIVRLSASAGSHWAGLSA